MLNLFPYQWRRKMKDHRENPGDAVAQAEIQADLEEGAQMERGRGSLRQLE
jgi:hypothetical protein